MQTLRELFATPREGRDDAWIASFFAAIPNAPLVTTPEQVMQGPDGFPYLVLKLPPDGAFEQRTVAGAIEPCTDKGLGIVIEPTSRGPEWVFDYGTLFSYRAYGTFVGDPADSTSRPGPAKEVLKEDTNVMVGSPNEEMLPSWARRAVARFLEQVGGVKEPKVCVMVEPSRAPARNLVFNIHPEDFPSPEAFERVLNRIGWFMPRGRSVIAVSRGALDDSFQPL
jgi:hypothetical protein